MNTALFAAIGLAAIASAGPASAQPAAPSTTVAYADLDLQDGRDARRMLRRIRNAAAEVCRASPGAEGTGIDAILLYDACFRQSVGRAVAQLDAPLVTAAYASKSPGQTLARRP